MPMNTMVMAMNETKKTGRNRKKPDKLGLGESMKGRGLFNALHSREKIYTRFTKEAAAYDTGSFTINLDPTPTSLVISIVPIRRSTERLSM